MVRSVLYTSYIKTQIPYLSQIRVIASEKGLYKIIFDTQDDFNLMGQEITKDDWGIFCALKMQLALYAKGELTEFTLPLDICGTDYQKKIWGLLQKIPYGTTVSYKDIALQANSYPQPVGGANSKNPLPIIIPCHRVINHDSTIGGYSGTIELKKALINLEGVKKIGEQGEN